MKEKGGLYSSITIIYHHRYNDEGEEKRRDTSERDGTPTPVIKVRYVHAVKGMYREGSHATCRSRDRVHVRAAVILLPRIGNKLSPASCAIAHNHHASTPIT